MGADLRFKSAGVAGDFHAVIRAGRRYRVAPGPNLASAADLFHDPIENAGNALGRVPRLEQTNETGTR